MNSVADRIIALDPYVSIAHSAMAHMSFSYGNIEKMIQEKQLAIDHAKYAEEEYQDYFDKLTITISLYHRQGDTEGEQYCIERLKDIPQQMQAVLEQTNPLAWRISDTPQLTLTNEQLSYLDSLE